MRKNILVLALLLCGGFSLAAQSRPDASIYVTPVTGTGSRPEDNSAFYKQLVLELTGQGFNLAKTQKGADYSLIGSLTPYTGWEGQFVLHLELRDNKTGEMKVEGELLYEAPDDVKQQFPVLVTALLYTIPPETVPAAAIPVEPIPAAAIPVDTIPVETGKNDEWRNKWLYLGLAATWTPRFYIVGGNSKYYGDPHGGFSAEFHFLNFLSFETGVELAADWPEKIYDIDTMIEIPFLLKFVIKPNAYFMLEPYAGAYFNISLRKTTVPSLFSWLAGFQYGVKVGPGAVFLDGRFAMDIGDTKVWAGNNPIPYKRYLFHIGLGYKYGLFQRNIK